MKTLGLVLFTFLAACSSKGSSTAGFASRDEAVREIFALLAGGDGAALFERSGVKTLGSLGTCDPPRAEQDAKDLEDARQELERAATREGGTKFEVLAITDGPRKTFAKGETIKPTCKLVSDFAAQPVSVSVRITRAGEVRETTVSMTLLVANDRWILTAAPKIDGCSAAVARFAALAGRELKAPELANKMQAPMMNHCIADKWPVEVTACTSKAILVRNVVECLTDLSADQRGKLAAELHPMTAGARDLAVVLQNIVMP